MTDYLLRAAALEGIAQQVSELGVDVITLFEKAGIPAGVDGDLDRMISYRSHVHLLELAAEETCIPHFGLLISRRQSESVLGTLWLAMSQGQDIRSALEILIQYHHFHNQGAIVDLQVQDELAIWTYTPKIPGEQITRQHVDLSMAIGIHCMRALLGTHWSPSSQHFVHSSPENTKPYRQMFCCPLYFDQEFNGTVFDAAVLDTQLQQSNPQLLQILQSHLTRAQSSAPTDIEAQLKYVIRKSMLDGDCSLDRVANDMFLSRRSLQRQLTERGTSYRTLLEEVRFDTATQYLRESRIPLKQLADMLGYSELTTFSRAFKRYFGKSPKQWRKRNR